MPTISCPQCQASLKSSEKKCPECGTALVVFNGQEWSSMSSGQKMNIYGVFTFMSTLISWMIVSAVSWMVGDFTLQAVPADVAYYGSIVVVAAGIYAATMKAFRRGDMNQ